MLNSMELEDDVLDELTKGRTRQTDKSTAAGRLANLMAGDIETLYNARDIVMMGIGIPIGSTLTLVGLYRIMGWSALVGTAIIVLSTPLPVWLAKLIGSTQIRLKFAQDSRISLVGEYISQ